MQTANTGLVQVLYLYLLCSSGGTGTGETQEPKGK